MDDTTRSFLDSWASTGMNRMQVRKTVIAYIVDKFAWRKLTKKQRKGFIPPDWYREETDAELRARMQAQINRSKDR
jgi:hypothetical protein